ncbi:MAG: DUF3995 domain-containing protein [Flavobacteriales bacterium]
MILILGVLLFIIFTLLSGLHFYWGFGGRWGGEASVPTKENGEKALMPKPVDCFVVALALWAFGFFVMVKIEMFEMSLPKWMLYNLLWFISALFIIRAIGDFKYIGFFKKIKTTRFGVMDTKYYSPLCLLIGIFGILIQIFA